MVTPLRSRLEATTIGLAQTMRSWLKAGVVKDSIMDVMDLNTNNYREEDPEVGEDSLIEDSEDDGKTLRPLVEDDGEATIIDD